jgi:uncharacterized protein YdeI (YjbR/CyaY-like superfamily)
MPEVTNPKFFSSPKKLREWLEKNHAKKKELWVGFHKKHTGKPSITWPQSVDEALCFGWIDGIRKGIDENSYAIRFTPRKRTSIWSRVNLTRIQELIRDKRIHPAGLAIYNARDPKKQDQYSFEQQRDTAQLTPDDVRKFKANPAAWEYFQSCPPGYRRIAAFYVVSAKRAETRARRLENLIKDSARGLRVGPLRRPGE